MKNSTRGLGSFLVALPLVCAAPPRAAAEEPTIETPPVATILDVAAGESQQGDGLRVRWTSVAYELSTGHDAEMLVEVDDQGRGDVHVYVDSEAILHVTTDAHGATTTWLAPDVDLPPEALAQLAAVNVADEIFAGVGDPQEFKCSDFGKKAVKAAKYLWIAATHAATVACCVGGVGVGCLVCGVGAQVAGAVGSDMANEYCD
jgi:hypothetical protein